MPDESFRNGDPGPKNAQATAVTDEESLLRANTPLDDELLPSIKLPAVSRWECAGLWTLIAASPVFLTIGYAFRTGRDLTMPFLVGETIVLLIGIGLTVLGLRQRDRLRGGVGVLAVLVAIVFGFFGLNAMLWCGAKDIPFEVIVSDSATGKPIRNATLEFEDREQVDRAQTDAAGAASIRWRCWTAGTLSPVCDTGGASFKGRVIVRAPGYVEFQQEIARLAGRGCSIHDPPPPPLKIRLKPIP